MKAWKEVSQKSPCEICEKETWCSRSEDGRHAVCRRESSWDGQCGKRKEDKSGGEYWVFRRGGETRNLGNQRQTVESGSFDVATIAERNEVYRYLLSVLPLHDQHKANLLSRGFKESEIERCLYRSHPGRAREHVAALLVEKFGKDLCKKIPGVLFKTDGSSERPTLAGGTGMFLPIVNSQSQITALNIRSDSKEKKNRYTLFSSATHGGSGPSLGAHVSQAVKQAQVGTVRITEGVIKADLATAITDVLTISVPGVGSWQLGIDTLKQLNPSRVLIAFDADFREKKQVAKALVKIYKTTKQLGFPVVIETWEPTDGKGIDDILKVGKKPMVLTSEQSDKLIADLSESLCESSGAESNPKPSYADIAASFLIDKKWYQDDQLHLRYWREDFYLWNGRSYRRLSKSDLRAEVVAYVQTLPLVREKSGAKHGNEVLANIEALTLVKADTEAPTWLDGRDFDAKLCIPMQNGILDVNAYLSGSTSPLLSHNPNFFNLAHVPYDFDPAAICPRFNSFIEEVQPDGEVRQFLQEWFGYNLIHDTTHAKFVIFVGQGANGKSVACCVLRTLLGGENVSSVGLDQFSSDRTFPLATTAGKLANIVEEMEEVSKTAEGALKNFIGGGVITIEKKFKDPIPVKSTARLTFATNSLPHFSDKTDGIWRRLVVIPFNVQILEEEKQDKRLIDPKFWIESGEIKGVLNFALAGLKRLKARGAFVEPKVCRSVKEVYRQDLNVIGLFLDDFCEMNKMGSVASNRLYKVYKDWSTDQGFELLNRRRFSDELKRKFPEVELTRNPRVQINGNRSREWIGIRLVQHAQHI